MNILALEPYYGGSHKAFLDGWSSRSRHTWELLTLPPHKWKWRMRHSAVTFSEQVRQQVEGGGAWDVLWCSDMLNLAEFKGLVPAEVSALPAIAYFHENQLTYPVRHEDERDYHFVLTNITTGLAADQVWFNTAYHRDSFLNSLPEFLDKMPDRQPFEVVEQIRAKAHIHPPGIDEFPSRPPRPDGPLHILWAARWEHDKNPDALFEALATLRSRGVPFRVSVIGEQFRDQPPVFEVARGTFADHIERWGYQKTRGDYEQALLEADVIVSTADHEFFGISVVEAVAAGAYPLLPKRLAYPEIFPDDKFLYDGTAATLAARLESLSPSVGTAEFRDSCTRAGEMVNRFRWSSVAATLDDALSAVRP